MDGSGLGRERVLKGKEGLTREGNKRKRGELKDMHREKEHVYLSIPFYFSQSC